MSRWLALIDFDGSITEITDYVLPNKVSDMPTGICQAFNLGEKELNTPELMQAALEGDADVAASKYKLVYVSSTKVFYGRFE